MESVTDSPRVLGNRYEVGDLLGRGGMAEVHLGRDTRLGRVVAIKLLRTDLARDPVFQARFRREAQSAAALNHPAIVAVYDTGEEQVVDATGSLVALPYIVMEFVEGRTLRDLLRGGHPLDLGLALELTSGVLSALDYSHRAGIVHRDIKPANVMLTPAGDVKVMDFGIARALADSSVTMTQTQAVIGTAQYLSPEQARGETVDTRSDLYSAGCLLFELVTGRPPFMADSPVAVAYQHVREAPPRPSDLNPTIPENLDRVILHSLLKDRESRYQTAAEFKADVDNVRSGRQVAAPVPGIDPQVDPRSAATTEYYGQTPTLAQPTAAYPEAMLPGAPAGYETTVYPTRREAAGSGGGRRGLGYLLLGLAVVAVFAGVTYGVQYVIQGSGAPVAQKIVMPDVTKQKETLARAALVKVGLVVKQPSNTVPSDTVLAGVVIGQDPPAKTQVTAGQVITLTVSSGKSSVAVPDVSNYTQEQARESLKNSGLVGGNAEEVEAPTIPKGHVVRTDPKAGTTVPVGSKVNLILSSGQVTVPDVTGKSYQDASKQLNALGLNVRSSDEQSDQPPGTVLRQDLTPNAKVDANSTITLTVAAAAPPTPTPTPTESPPSGPPSQPGTPSPSPS